MPRPVAHLALRRLEQANTFSLVLLRTSSSFIDNIGESHVHLRVVADGFHSLATVTVKPFQ